MILTYSILAGIAFFIWCLCRAAARGDTYRPTVRQLRQWRRERLALDVQNRRQS